eukprot:COSAG01_NODE_2421_length_7726_cov_72.763472_8_plen_100_part_00
MHRHGSDRRSTAVDRVIPFFPASSNSASYMAQHSIPEAPGMEGVEPPVIGTGERVRAMMAKVGVLLEGELQGRLSEGGQAGGFVLRWEVWSPQPARAEG